MKPGYTLKQHLSATYHTHTQIFNNLKKILTDLKKSILIRKKYVTGLNFY